MNFIKRIIFKIYNIIKNFIKEFPGLTFIIISILIIQGTIYYYDEYQYRQALKEQSLNSNTEIEQRYIRVANEEIREDINTSIDREITAVRNYFSGFNVFKAINDVDKITYWVEVPVLSEISTVNKEIQKDAINLALSIHAVYEKYGYDFLINIEAYAERDSELVYFTVENYEVSWTRYDKQIKWRKGDDLTEWQTTVESGVEAMDEEEYNEYIDLLKAIEESAKKDEDLYIEDNEELAENLNILENSEQENNLETE